MPHTIDGEHIRSLEDAQHVIEKYKLNKEDVTNYNTITVEGKKLLLQALHYPGYVSVWMSLSPLQKNEMEKNIKITEDGKIEIIQMKKKFSILTAQHNGKDVFAGEYVDKHGNTGLKGVRYMTGKAAERECEKQGKTLLNDAEELQRLICFFPGEEFEDKILNFIKLFGLKKAGYLEPNDNTWHKPRSHGYVRLTRVVEDERIYGVSWEDDGYPSMSSYEQIVPSIFIAGEAC